MPDRAIEAWVHFRYAVEKCYIGIAPYVIAALRRQDIEKPSLNNIQNFNRNTMEQETTSSQPFAKLPVSGSFSLEQMKAAFQAGKEWIWEDLEQTTTCSKWESFEEWFAEWSQNYR